MQTESLRTLVEYSKRDGALMTKSVVECGGRYFCFRRICQTMHNLLTERLLPAEAMEALLDAFFT